MTNPQAGRALDCNRARALIDAFLLDELAPGDAARLAAHVKGCAACTAEIGSSTRVLGLLGSMPVPRSTPDLDERILLAALDDRVRRHAHRSWLTDLRSQVIRGAMRTTGTLIVTILSVALLGGAFVFAASQVVSNLPVFTGQTDQDATMPPVATPTPTAPAAQVEPSTNATSRPSPVDSATPEPATSPAAAESVEPSLSAEPSPTPTPTPGPSESATPSVEPSPTATADPTPTPTPTPSPTDKPRRTPPPSEEPSPLP